MKSDLAVTCLIQEMENRREEVIVILAGYPERMRSFLEINEGLKSRVPYWIDFPDYSVDELSSVFAMMTEERGFAVTEEVLQEARSIFEKVRGEEDWVLRIDGSISGISSCRMIMCCGTIFIA